MKTKLLRVIDDGRAHERELVALVVEEPANADGTWTAKDHLAHLSWWRRRSARTLEAVRTGGEMPPAVDEDDNVTNAQIYAETKDRSAADVKAEAESSWTAVRNVVEASAEDDLAKLHPERKDTPIWELVPGAVGHSGTHVWSWYLDIGEEARAIAGAKWSAEIEERFFSTPEKLAGANYNLACVYARLGRVEEALPLLRASFEAQPELRAWARKDHDLDPIRDDRQVRQLLAR